VSAAAGGGDGGDGSWDVLRRTDQFSGAIMDVVSDEVRMPDGSTAVRDYVVHPGAVAVVAVDAAAAGAEDAGPRVLLIRQYRHPVGRELWELPAGLLDVEGERALATAARELAEEADLRASRWDVLADLLLSPGGSDEAIRLYLARDLRAVPPEELHARKAEEAAITTAWFSLDDAVAMVLGGEIENASCATGVLAAEHAAARDWRGLRPVDAPWPARPGR